VRVTLIQHYREKSKIEKKEQEIYERTNGSKATAQSILDVDSVNCFKNHLQRLRNTRMRFFAD